MESFVLPQNSRFTLEGSLMTAGASSAAPATLAGLVTGSLSQYGLLMQDGPSINTNTGAIDTVAWTLTAYTPVLAAAGLKVPVQPTTGLKIGRVTNVANGQQLPVANPVISVSLGGGIAAALALLRFVFRRV